jgi:site-specific recombinase XerD
MALLRKDVPLEVIQRLLGHESIATTQIYAHNDIDDVQAKVDKFDM